MKKFFVIGIFVIFFVGCNFITSTSPDFGKNVSTAVSQQLTASPISMVNTSEIPTEIGSTVAYQATESPQPTLTETSTPTTTLTPTLSADDPRLKLGSPTWKEDFSKDNQNFYQFENDQTRVIYESGNLVLTAKNPINWVGWSLSAKKPKDFYLEATFKTMTCSGLDRYGLVFRAPDTNNGYFLGFSCDGKYSLRIYSQQGNLITWTPNSAINSGSNQVNRIGVSAQGDRFAFYANGKLLTETKESTFTEGGLFGAFIAAANTSNFTVNLDEIAYWNK
jgi:hypothetical protein